MLERIAIATAAGLLLTWLLARAAHAIGMIDHPGGHKHHARPVAMVGGLAVAMAIAATLAIRPLPLTGAQWALLAAAFAMLLTGLADDRFRLTPAARLVAQAAAALLLATLGDGALHDLGALFGGERTVALGWFVLPMTVFSVVGTINACNMSDGMDGVAGGFAVLALGGALLLAEGHAAAVHAPIVAAAIGAVIGFLFWNQPLLRSARAYLGDGGSLLLGTLLAWVMVHFSQGPDRAFAPAAALWLYALPLIDTVSVMWRRMAEGRSPFQPDQRHVHHMLLRAGLSTRTAWLILMLAALAGVTIAVVATRARWPEPLLAAVFLVVAFAHHFSMRHADRNACWLGRVLARDLAELRSAQPEPHR
jgi:UDP-GlcNAc:undecaprenyl-phosphate GlcNAc-1-phosphate transferase